MEYKIELLIDSTYQVVSIIELDGGDGQWEREIHFQGSMTDCVAWIQAKREGWLE